RAQTAQFSTLWRTVWTTVGSPGIAESAPRPVENTLLSRPTRPRAFQTLSTGAGMWTDGGQGNPRSVDGCGHVDKVDLSPRTPSQAAIGEGQAVDGDEDKRAVYPRLCT